MSLFSSISEIPEKIKSLQLSSLWTFTVYEYSPTSDICGILFSSIAYVYFISAFSLSIVTISPFESPFILNISCKLPSYVPLYDTTSISEFKSWLSSVFSKSASEYISSCIDSFFSVVLISVLISSSALTVTLIEGTTPTIIVIISTNVKQLLILFFIYLPPYLLFTQIRSITLFLLYSLFRYFSSSI